MAVLRLHALSQLADCIADRIPTLKGRICAGPAESPHRLAFPSLAIIAVRFRYFPDQAVTHTSVGATSVVMNVGRHEGTVQLRLGAQSQRLRAQLEQEILDIFLGDTERPGILLTPIPRCHDATVAWELDRDEWDNEKAFDKKWYSILSVRAQLPALVTLGGVHTLDDIRSTFSEDIESTATEIPEAAQETVSIQLDGSIEAAANP